MRHVRPTRLTTCGTAMLLAPAASGCSGDSDGALHEALDRISAQALERDTHEDAVIRMESIHFADNARIMQLPDERWHPATMFAAPGPEANQSQWNDLGFDFDGADYSISVGFGMPTSITLVAGGQDADEIGSAAQQHGYFGDAVLETSESNSNRPAKITASGSDASWGGPDADLSLVDPGSETLLDQPKIAEIADCLGDPLLAAISQHGEFDAHQAVGVGVGTADGKTVAVFCVPGDAAKADALVELLTNGGGMGATNSEYFSEIDVSSEDGMVRATATLDDRFSPTAALRPYYSGELTEF